MKRRSSLKSLKKRDKNCVLVKRRGRIFVLNKECKKFKACQG
ncbi:ribosomal protein bL36 [Candidatus Sarmatiella mevalonica]|nr:ribosomal protein bL36 [Candidatus Sarmatiella mevalonica]